MTQLERVRTELDKRDDRSAWDKGVADYAHDLLDNIEVAAHYGKPTKTIREWKELMLNGAGDWNAYSYGGCAFIYNEDIAQRLCTPSELKRKRNGELKPNSRETWLDVQARALSLAEARITFILRYKLGLR